MSTKGWQFIVHLICWEWLLSTSSFLQSVLYLSSFHSQHAYISFLAWLELLLESGPPGPKRILHGRPVKQTNKYLDSHTTEQLVHAFVTSRLDISNALLYGLSKEQTHRLQSIQNTAACLVTQTKPSCHITPIMFDLHWLPVHFRCQYKLLLTHCAVNGLAPSYITGLLDSYKPSRSGLHSSNKNLLAEKKSFRSWGDRAFAVAAPRLWNS